MHIDVNEREREEVSSEDAENEDIEDDFRSHGTCVVFN